MKELTTKEMIDLYSGTITEEDYKRIIEPYNLPDFRGDKAFTTGMEELIQALIKEKYE